MDFIPISQPSIGARERAYLLDAFDSGWISSLGRYINDFEKSFASYCGTAHAVCVSNGTVALHLALEGISLKEGDEVIVPDLTFVATANAVKHAGGVPVIVDVDAETLCMNPSEFEAAITPRTRAVIPVHLYGHPADMNRIMSIARKHGIDVVEDAAEAHGAELDGKKVGSFGRCATFSFYGNKIITTGEGGMITTDDSGLAERLRLLRDHAMSRTRKYWHGEIGYNYRLTNLQAAIGLAQLERIEELLGKKRVVFESYEHNLGGIPGVRLNPTRPGCRNSYWMVCLECDDWDEDRRASFMAELKRRNVDSRPYFCPLTDLPMYDSPAARTPVAHAVSRKGINLPSFVDMTDEMVRYVCAQVTGILGAR